MTYFYFNRLSISLAFAAALLVGCASTPSPFEARSSRNALTEKDGKLLYFFSYGKKTDPPDGPKSLRVQEKIVGNDDEEVISAEKGFSSIYPYSDKRAIVEYKKDGKIQIADYNYEKDKLTPLPNSKIVDIEGHLFTYNEPSAKDQPFDLYFHTPLSQSPRVYKNIGGGPLHQMSNQVKKTNDVFWRRPGFIDSAVAVFPKFIVIYSIDEEGRPVSQLLDLKGDPISPRIGYVHRIHYLNGSQAVSLVGKIPGEYMNTDSIFLPIDSNGKFIPLPGDAKGVTYTTNRFGWIESWIVLFPDEKGLMGVVYRGSIEKMPASLSSEPRITDFVLTTHKVYGRVEYDNLAVRGSDGRWSYVKGATDHAMNSGIGAQNLTNREQVLTYIKNYDERVEKMRAEERVAQQKIIDEQNRILEIERNKKREILSQQLQALPNICHRFRDAIDAGPLTGERFLKECDVPYMTWIDIAAERGISPSAIDDARKKFKNRITQEEKTRLRLEEEAKQRQYSRGGGLLEHLQKTTGSASPASSLSAPSQQQQRYQWERELNRQLYNRDYDPSK